MGIGIRKNIVFAICDKCDDEIFCAPMSTENISRAEVALAAHVCEERDPDFLSGEQSVKYHEITDLIRVADIPRNEAELILSQFRDHIRIISKWERDGQELIVTDETQTSKMETAGIARKAVMKARTSAKRMHDELKSESLRRGQFIDGIYRVIAAHAKKIEEHLIAQEKYIERKREAELAERQREIERRIAQEEAERAKLEAEHAKQSEYDERAQILAENERLRNEVEKLNKFTTCPKCGFKFEQKDGN